MEKIIICRARKGRYSNPIPLTQTKIKLKGKIRCDNADNLLHSKQKWFNYDKMYVQEWVMTKEELKKVIDEFDCLSLDMPIKIICPDCYKTLGGVI